MNGQPPSRLGPHDITKGKTPIVCLTAYTADVARLLDPHVDLLLVGDSVGMVLYGFANTPIGIGASATCDGQILVINDALGLTQKPPRFAKRFTDVSSSIAAAAEIYAHDVRTHRFPGAEHTFGAKSKQNPRT